MLFLRNWVIPLFFAGLGALLGLLIVGLPGFNIVMSVDGSPLLTDISPEQIDAIIHQGKQLVSHVEFYGIAFPGEPLYWIVGIVAVMAIIGYRIGAKFKVRQPSEAS